MFICLWHSRSWNSCNHFFLVILFHFTLGVFLASKKLDFNLLFKSPPFYAIIISVLFLYYEIEVPVFLINTTMMLTYAAIFLILMSLGIALLDLKYFHLRSALYLQLLE